MSNTTPQTSTTASAAAPTQPPAAPGSAGMTFAQVENAWIQAGGNPQAAAMAASVADAESGLNPNATMTNPDGTQAVGLWLIPANTTPVGSTDPIANARAAIQLSNNGTDWSQWCTTWSDNNCGLNQGTYLGEGANALASLAQQSSPASYNVVGASPTGTGTSAGAAAASATPGSTSSSHTLLYIGALLVIILAVFVMTRRKTGESGESTTRSQAPWSSAEEAMLNDNTITDKELSSQTGRSVRAIRVRRNQAK